MGLMIISFIATFLAIVAVGLLLFYRNPAAERFSQVIGGRPGAAGGLLERLTARRRTSVESLVKPFENILPRSAAEVSVIQKRLIRAGYRKNTAVSAFYASKVLVPAALTALAALSGAYRWSPMLVFALALGVGFLAPDYWLTSRITSRRLKIDLGLPQALDLMVICTEAGLGLEQTISRVSSELQTSQPEISEEFGLMILEQKAGLAHESALKNLAERTGTPNSKALINTLVQAEKYGTNIAKTLRVYADTMRTKRKQRAEELAAKTTVKLVFPLVLFVFPSLFVVTLGPAMISIGQNFQVLNK